MATINWVSNAFCDGCSRPGMAPSTEPRWAARASRSSTCSPCSASACKTLVLALPVGPHNTRRFSVGVSEARRSITWAR